jgi:uncharacterized protein YbjT (DUF2867 family)
MRIAIVGGTGTLGRHVVAALAARGRHEVRLLSRGSPDFPVDLASGEGLASALEGCQAVVDASNATSARRAEQILVQGSRRLLAAEEKAGVRHHVCVSIVGCERVPMGYYRVKTEQESVVEHGPVPYSIVRATQFHELAATALDAAGRWRVLPVPRIRLQTVAAEDVADLVADVAVGEPRDGRVQIAGPEVMTARELAQTWLSVTGRSALMVPVPLPGKLGRALRDGGLTALSADTHGRVTFADWLASSPDRGKSASPAM